jgi:hypothetical protein
MSAAVDLRDTPSRFLDPGNWAELRSFASNDLIALTYINAPYPDQNDPGGFFWGRHASFEEALHCYELGRELLDETRYLLVQRKLTAVGTTPYGQRKVIAPLAWTSLWPMFATNRARGRNSLYNEVEVYEAPPLESSDQKTLLDCINWLRVHQAETSDQPKKVLIFRARTELEGHLTDALFNVAYKIVFGLKRGRRRISPKN